MSPNKESAMSHDYWRPHIRLTASHGLVDNQINDLDEMRHLLCEKYGICDYQSLEGMEGRHS
jgi:hypothetical protein